MARHSGYGFLIFVFVAIALSAYFAFAAIQGDLGVLKRAQISSDIASLRAERQNIAAQVEALENKTRRMSDRYLDLDLFNERARDVLGMMRADELAVR